MKKFILHLLSIFEKKKDTRLYTIKELNELRQREKKMQLAKKSREYISELNKKQRLWLEKNNRNSRKVS